MHAVTEALGIAAAALFAAGAGVIVRLHVLPTGRDPLRDAVSDYGAGVHHRNYRVMVVLLGLGAAVLAAGLARDGRASDAGVAWLAAYAVSRIAISGFMTDLPHRPITGEGRVHAWLAAIAFTSIAFASADATSALEDAPGWSGGVHGVMQPLARAVVITAIATLVCYVVPPLRHRVFGFVERLLYVSSLAWLITTAVHLAALNS